MEAKHVIERNMEKTDRYIHSAHSSCSRTFPQHEIRYSASFLYWYFSGTTILDFFLQPFHRKSTQLCYVHSFLAWMEPTFIIAFHLHRLRRVVSLSAWRQSTLEMAPKRGDFSTLQKSCPADWSDSYNDHSNKEGVERKAEEAAKGGEYRDFQ